MKHIVSILYFLFYFVPLFASDAETKIDSGTGQDSLRPAVMNLQKMLPNPIDVNINNLTQSYEQDPVLQNSRELNFNNSDNEPVITNSQVDTNVWQNASRPSIMNLQKVLPNPININNNELLQSYAQDPILQHSSQSYYSNGEQLSGTNAANIVNSNANSLTGIQKRLYSDETSLNSCLPSQNETPSQEAKYLSKNEDSLDSDMQIEGSGLPDNQP
ncbi:MAG TPA: hypothetical protein DD381_07685 [Lentisphaeria bacterium]|nr:MAG: hypothetical protein A2X47_04250 [Lentisphaerae bacterium GWF2_38_69]HBM16202.1 hypothetical protein [Lentisphaeria bacterium]